MYERIAVSIAMSRCRKIPQQRDDFPQQIDALSALEPLDTHGDSRDAQCRRVTANEESVRSSDEGDRDLPVKRLLDLTNRQGTLAGTSLSSKCPWGAFFVLS